MLNNEIRWVKACSAFLVSKYGEDAPMVGFDANTYVGMVWETAGLDGAEYNYVKPTQAELEATWEQIKAEESRKNTIRDRVAGYPSLEEQADMQYWDAINGTTVWLDTIAAIKLQFPKTS